MRFRLLSPYLLRVARFTCYWAHLITDDKDYNAHMDYVHINPLKHGLVKQVSDWPYSTFHRHVDKGVYPKGWAGASNVDLDYDD